jgi:hypothetical protein
MAFSCRAWTSLPRRRSTGPGISTINFFGPPTNDDNIPQWQQQQSSDSTTLWVDDNNEKDKNENNDKDVSWRDALLRSSSNVWKERLWHGDDDADDYVRFEVAVVPATSTPINSALTRVPHLLRASVLYYTTTTEELDLLCRRLDDWIHKSGEQKADV